MSSDLRKSDFIYNRGIIQAINMPENTSAIFTKEASNGLSEGGTAQAHELFHVIPDQNEITEDASFLNPTTLVTYTGVPTQGQNYIFAQEHVPTQQHTLMTLDGSPPMNQVTYVPVEGDALQHPMGIVRPAEDSSRVWALDDPAFVRYLGLGPPVETKSLDDNYVLTDLLPSSSDPPSLSSALPSIFDDDLSTDCVPVIQESQVDLFINGIVQDRATSNSDEPVPLPPEGGVISEGHPQQVSTAVSGGSAREDRRAAPSRRSRPARKSSASSPSSNSSSAGAGSARSRRRNKKSKAYEREEPFANMNDEKKRLNAINAKKNRDLKKLQYEQMKKNLEDAIKEKNALLEDLKRMRQHEEKLRTELEKKGIEFPCL